jgi:hypothetical protein
LTTAASRLPIAVSPEYGHGILTKVKHKANFERETGRG